MKTWKVLLTVFIVFFFVVGYAGCEGKNESVAATEETAEEEAVEKIGVTEVTEETTEAEMVQAIEKIAATEKAIEEKEVREEEIAEESEPENKTLEGRRKELEEMKDKDFYSDPVLLHLGWTKEEIMEKYGTPDNIYPHYLGGEEFYYENKAVIFVFTGDEGVVNNLYLYPRTEILGIRVGMTFDEIEAILGKPRFRGFDDFSGGYMLTYFLGDQTESLGELELWITAESENSPTERIDVLWKKYWQPIE